MSNLHIDRAIIEHTRERNIRADQLADFTSMPVSEHGQQTVRWFQAEIEYHQGVIDALASLVTP